MGILFFFGDFGQGGFGQQKDTGHGDCVFQRHPNDACRINDPGFDEIDVDVTGGVEAVVPVN